jgi:hypothetical protein
MDEKTDTQAPPDDPSPEPVRAVRLPSLRACAVLAAAMLAVGAGVGAAIGPAPDASLAGGVAGLAQRLPLILASIAAGEHTSSSAPAGAAAEAPPASTPRHRHARQRSIGKGAGTTSPTTAATTSAPSLAEPSPTTPTNTGATKNRTLPAITSVWLIELSGGTFAQALAQTGAAPYIDGQLIPAGTLLSGWSALAAGAFASDAALADPLAPGASPPILRSIVQPPCPEGAAGSPCAPETSGQLTAADEFLKATMAQITTSAAYREHGLVVVTFATVAVAAAAGLPAGASSATLASQPPAGALLVSPFARAGARPKTTFDPTSPRRSLEALLH